MKALVISDTHKNISNVIDVMNRIKDVDRIIHLGDYVRDAESIESIFPRIPIDYVAGNCDLYENDTPREKMIHIMGKNIFMTHGHYLNVKRNYTEITDYGFKKGADVILFGHTHYPYTYEMDNLLMMNPGSISSGRSEDRETFGILELDKNGSFHVTIGRINKNKKRY